MSRTSTISSWLASNVTTRWLAGSSDSPAQISAYISATRVGVRSRPSRSGSSPIATRISRTACSIRGRSTGPVASETTRNATNSVIRFPLLGGQRARVLRDEGQVPVALVDIEPVPDDESVGDRETHVFQFRVDALEPFFHEQGAHLERGGGARAGGLAQVPEGGAGINDVLDDEDVPIGEGGIEILHDADDATRAGGGSVRRNRHEVELHGQVNRAREIGHEHERALEDPHEQRRAAGVVGREVFPE